MATKMVPVQECDIPECNSEEDVWRVGLAVPAGPHEIDLCPRHRTGIGIEELLKVARRRDQPKKGRIIPVDPATIPRRSRD